MQSVDCSGFWAFLIGLHDVAAIKKHRKVLGETIRSCRKASGMSQERFGEKADLHPKYVGELERGEKAATIDTLVKVAKALGIRPSELLRDL
ncbi:MAG: family transcriptional regulator [Pedosphaera sp.]|nr:family transcriptional regulator [Pedosphaera sp.]